MSRVEDEGTKTAFASATSNSSRMVAAADPAGPWGAIVISLAAEPRRVSRVGGGFSDARRESSPGALRIGTKSALVSKASERLMK